MSSKNIVDRRNVSFYPNSQQFKAFDERLKNETELLKEWFDQKKFSEDELQCGSELEFFLIDDKLDLCPDNLNFINSLHKKYLIPEVGCGQLEINSKHFILSGDGLEKLGNNLKRYWEVCFNKAREVNKYLIMIGHPPTATMDCQRLDFLTNKKRYKIIDSCMRFIQQNKKIALNIEGNESLQFEAESLAMDGLTASFQLHLQVGLNQSVSYYNAAQLITAPLTAVCANSPFLFGHDLWSETRVSIFREVMTLSTRDHPEGFKCCLFGTNYLTESFFELFEQNYYFFPRLLPLSPYRNKNKFENMSHVRIQNGVVYRWNRPVIDFSKNGSPHLRIEHRAISSGPTIVDMIANAAFFYGLLNYYATEYNTGVDKLVPFRTAKENFYQAAKYGLTSNITWINGNVTTVQALILNTLLKEAKIGLQKLNIEKEHIEYYLSIIKQRVTTLQNGCQWQRDWIKKYGKDFYGLTHAYLQNQVEGHPVHTWNI